MCSGMEVELLKGMFLSAKNVPGVCHKSGYSENVCIAFYS